MSQAPTIAVRGLTKRFGARTVVDNVNLTVQPGRICGFLGPNGSGKTTTLRMICGLLIPDAGEGEVLGLDLGTQRRAIKQQIGYMTQKFGLFGDLTIRENLEFVARVYGIADPKRRVNETLERLGLTKRQDQLAGQLSGGWKQRMALAACMLHDPQLLLLDEPTAGVDPKARRDFWEEIHALSAEGLTVLVSTHYMDEAERCDRIVYILNGKMVTRGSVAEVIAESGLVTFTLEGDAVRHLAQELQDKPGVDYAGFFGAALHVSGRDRAALEAAIAPYRDRPGLTVFESPPSLEDVFIHLQEEAR